MGLLQVSLWDSWMGLEPHSGEDRTRSGYPYRRACPAQKMKPTWISNNFWMLFCSQSCNWWVYPLVSFQDPLGTWFAHLLVDPKERCLGRRDAPGASMDPRYSTDHHPRSPIYWRYLRWVCIRIGIAPENGVGTTRIIKCGQTLCFCLLV